MSQPGTHMGFQRLTEKALHTAEIEALPAYVAAAKAAGADAEARTAVHMLLFREEARMRNRVRLRIPVHLAHHADTVADWVIARVTRSALRLSFRGETIGEWRAFINSAITNQVISFWRTSQGQALEQETILPEEHADRDDVTDDLGDDFDADRLASRLDAEAAVAAVLRRITNPDHRAVIKAAFWDDLPSIEIAQSLGLTAANVDQIKSRFRRELRAELTKRGFTDHG